MTPRRTVLDQNATRDAEGPPLSSDLTCSVHKSRFFYQQCHWLGFDSGKKGSGGGRERTEGQKERSTVSSCPLPAPAGIGQGLRVDGTRTFGRLVQGGPGIIGRLRGVTQSAHVLCVSLLQLR